MSVDGGSAPRQFVAFSPPMSSQMTAFATGKGGRAVMLALILVMVAMFVTRQSQGVVIVVAGLVALSIFGVVGTAYVWWRSRRKVLIDVTSDGLTLNQRAGHAFSFADAKLGPWVTMGVALHLHRGSRRFVLGGRDRRIAPATRLDGPPVQTVDAWLWAAEFDELLAVGGPPGGSGCARACARRTDPVPAISQPLFGRTDGVVRIPQTTSAAAITLETEPGPGHGPRRDTGDRPEQRCARSLGVGAGGERDSGNVPARQCHERRWQHVRPPRLRLGWSSMFPVGNH